jgi:hypothetical protein
MMSLKIGPREKSLVCLFCVSVMALMLCGGMERVFAQESQVDLQALVQETQKMSQKADEMTLLWWIPEEYWRVSLTQTPNMPAAQVEEIVSHFAKYVLLVVVDGKMGSFGGITYKTEPEIRGSIEIKDKQGVSYAPLSEDKIDADTKNLLSMLKPVLINMLGPMGQNMHFFLFPMTSETGQKIAAAKNEGAFSVKLGERQFRWRLPLGSLLPAKICPTCNEKLSGAYKFCPWDGTKLPGAI